MTFVFDDLSAAIFVLCYLTLLLICFSGLQRYEEVCPKHPGVKDCIHRTKGEKK